MLFRRLGLLVIGSVLLAGCEKGPKPETKFDDDRNPYYTQAKADLDAGSPAKAVADYEAALGACPELPGAHYQLGHLYADKLNDLPGAIFHYQYYLKLAPSGDKVEEVRAQIDKLSTAFAASVPNTTTQNAEDYAKLQAENASLRKQVDDATRDLTQLKGDYAKLLDKIKELTAAQAVAATAPAPGVPGAPVETNGTNTVVGLATPPKALPLDATNVAPLIAPPPGTAPSTGGARSYTVAKGDKLWTIAKKMYPGENTKEAVEKIQEANKDALTGKPLKIGQVLVIP